MNFGLFLYNIIYMCMCMYIYIYIYTHIYIWETDIFISILSKKCMYGIYYCAFESFVFDVPSKPFLSFLKRPSVKIYILFKGFRSSFFLSDFVTRMALR